MRTALALLFFAALGYAQNPGPVFPVGVAPSGACGNNVMQLVGPGGLVYTCQNGTWAQISGGGGGGTWGSITGTLSSQTDLQTALNGKLGTAGNAATATALATLPTPCSSTQAATGILANGNSTGCFTPGGSGINWIRFSTIVQATVAGTNFSLPSVNYPGYTGTPGSGGALSHENTTNSGNPSAAANAWNYGTLPFLANTTAATAQSVQGMIPLASTWSSTAGIPVSLVWLAPVSTTGNVLWQIQGQCVATGATPGNFGMATAFTASTVAGTVNLWTYATTLTMTTSTVLSGCTAGSTFLFRLFRDHQNAADTMTGTAELVSASLGVTE